MLHSPTTPYLFNMWKYADILKWDVSPLIKPSASEPYYTMSIWHVEACRHTKMRLSPLIKPQHLIALLHHVCLTWGSMQIYWNEMYPPNQTQCFRALLHHVCLTCGSMQTYPNEMYPPNQTQCFHSCTSPCPFDMWKLADIPKWDVSSLIKPSHLEPSYNHVHLTCGSM